MKTATPLSLITSWLLLSSVNDQVYALDQPPLEVRVRLSPKSEVTKLEIKLTSHLDGEVVFYKDDLPWRALHNMILVIARDRFSGDTLERIRPIQDPGPDIEKLESGASLSGEIDLEAYFPTLEQERKKSELILFWFYEPQTMDGMKYAKQGGWLELPMKLARSK